MSAGFDGFKWLSDLHVLDVSKLEESEITSHSVTHLLNDFRSLVNNAGEAAMADAAAIATGVVCG